MQLVCSNIILSVLIWYIFYYTQSTVMSKRYAITASFKLTVVIMLMIIIVEFMTGVLTFE